MYESEKWTEVKRKTKEKIAQNQSTATCTGGGSSGQVKMTSLGKIFTPEQLEGSPTILESFSVPNAKRRGLFPILCVFQFSNRTRECLFPHGQTESPRPT
ncbi:UNVERIFIED_CONTAM: hypothetical protein FKN15_018627 [Acipenser sinensis]